MAAAPVDLAASMIRSTARYDCDDGAGPISTASSAMITNAAWRSASLCTATVRTPRSLQARMTRSAISPRLATSTFSNMRLLHVDQRVARAHHIALLHVHVGHGPRPRGGDVVLHLHRLAHADDVAEIDVVAHLHRYLEQEALHRSDDSAFADRRRATHGWHGPVRGRADVGADDAHCVRLTVNLHGQIADRQRRGFGLG